MEKYIDANAIYKKAVALEESAFEILNELNNKPLEEMSEKEKFEWVKWSVILTERTAFKFDVADAPAADVRKNVHGWWIDCKGSNGKDYRKCSNCLHTQEITGLLNYCPVCGADMMGVGDDDERIGASNLES